MQHTHRALSAFATAGVAALDWPIQGTQTLYEGVNKLEVTPGEAKMLRHAGAISKTEQPGVWLIAEDYGMDSVQNTLYEAAQDLAEHRELHGIPEDTPSLANCDDAGTGEGRWHGRV